MVKHYKEIWNNLSTNLEDASFFVCCIGDEEEIRKNGTLTANFLRELLYITSEDKVLEIGCGIGRIGRELAPYCREWHGADISGNMIAHARERTQGIPNVYLHELPGNALHIFADNSFDCVYSSIVFMHLDKPDMFTYICEAYRVLKPGGRVYFDTWNLLSPVAWQEFLKIVETFPSGMRPGHVGQFSTPEEIRKYMDEAGYESVHIDGNNPELVVALGCKALTSVKQADGVNAAAEAVARAVAKAAASSQATSETFSDTGPVDISTLHMELHNRGAYISSLEAELERKNAAISVLETRLVWRESELVAAREPRLPWKRRKSKR